MEKHVLDKKKLKNRYKHAYTIPAKILKSKLKKNKFKISAPLWNGEFELLDGSYHVSEIQNRFKYILKNTEKRLTILQ